MHPRVNHAGGRSVESVAGSGYDIGQLQEWPLHSLLSRTVFQVRGRRQGKRVERASSGFEMPLPTGAGNG